MSRARGSERGSTFVLASAAVAWSVAGCTAHSTDVTASRESSLELEAVAFVPGLHEVQGGTWLVCRVVDSITSEPVVGARLHPVAEAAEPVDARFASVRHASSDRDGFVRMRVDDLPRVDWTFAFAEGYAPDAECTTGPRLVELHRGTDVPIELRDEDDRPVADAELSLVIGCGHTPDVRSVRTDSNGRAIVPDVALDGDGIRDLYVRHPRLAAGYESIDWRPGDDPIVLRWPPGRSVVGRLLDERGAPIAGAAVGSRHVHRGPWSATDREGGFRIIGLPLDIRELEVVRNGSAVGFWMIEPSRETLELRLGHTAAIPTEPGPRSRVALTLDGFSDPDLRHVSLRVEYRLPTGDALDVTQEFRRTGTIEVASDGGGRVLVDCSGERGHANVPRPLPAGVALVVRPSPLGTTVIRGRFVGSAARVANAGARIDSDALVVASDGSFSWTRRGEGTPCDLEFASSPTFVRSIRVPKRNVEPGATRVLDLGSIELTDAPSFRWHAAPPRSWWLISVHRAGVQVASIWSGWDDERDVRSYEHRGEDAREGDVAVLRVGLHWEAEEPSQDPCPVAYAHYVQTLQGAGPWTIQPPSRAVRFELVDGEGQPLRGQIVAPGIADPLAIDGTLEVRHLPRRTGRAFAWTADRRVGAVDLGHDGLGVTRAVITAR